jgi:hypothetical protein
MAHPHLSKEEIVQLGGEIYERSIRSQVETADNIGKIMLHVLFQSHKTK